MTDFYNSKIPNLFKPKDADMFAITFMQWTWYNVPMGRVAMKWRRHGDQHKKQYKENGVFKFLFLYLHDYIRGRCNGWGHEGAYLAIRFEVEARAAEKL